MIGSVSNNNLLNLSHFLSDLFSSPKKHSNILKPMLQFSKEINKHKQQYLKDGLRQIAT